MALMLVDEKTNASGSDLSVPRPASAAAEVNVALEKKTWRKVDLHIMTVSVLLYLASYIDR
jgi:hypothetical protein